MTSIADFRAYHWARAGIGSPVEEAAIDAVVSWRELEDRFEQDVNCEILHDDCCGGVSAMAFSCKPPEKACKNAERNIRQALADGDIHCADCGVKVDLCWRVVPI